MSDDRKYVRIYAGVVDDERFVGIYDDDHHWATYTRLLMLADAAWPASAPLPRSARRASVAALSAAGIIELGTADRFRIHGLDPERQRRADHARSAAENRWSNAPGNAASSAPGNAQSMLAKQSRTEQSKDEQSMVLAASSDDGGRPDIEAFLGTRFRLPTPAQRTFMDTFCQVFDQTGPERAARLIWSHPDDPIGALKEDLAAFREERRTEAIKADVPKPRRTKGSGLTGISAELAKLYLAPSNGDKPVPLAEMLPDAYAAVGYRAESHPVPKPGGRKR